MAISEARRKMIEEDAKLGEGSGATFYYVDRNQAETFGLVQFKPAVGNNFIRIVARDGDDNVRLLIWRHQNVGASKNTFLCLNKMYSEPCPICEKLAEIRTENPKHPALDEMYAGRRVLLYVVDTTSDETIAEGTKWFDCPPSIYTNIVELAKDSRTGECIDVFCPDEGCGIIFDRKNKKGNPYTGFKLESPSRIPDEWFANLPLYEDLLIIPEYQKMQLEVDGYSAHESPAPRDEGANRARGGAAAPATASRRAAPETASSRRAAPADDNTGTTESPRRERQPDTESPAAQETTASSSRRGAEPEAEALTSLPEEGAAAPVVSKLDEIRKRRRDREQTAAVDGGS